MLRIAMISPYDWTCPGGVNAHVRDLTRYLRRRGHVVDIIAPASTALSHETRVIQIPGRITSVSFAGARARVTLSPTAWGRIDAVLQGGSYDIVHVHEPLVPIVSLAAVSLSRSITIGTFHHFGTAHAGHPLARLAGRLFLNKLNGRIAVSTPSRDFVQSYLPGNCYIIPNGVAVDEFQNPRIAPWDAFRSDGMLNILFVGRLDRRKGFKTLLRAFRLVKRRLPTARLIVVGAFSPRESGPFLDHAHSHEIRDVVFIGPASEAEKAAWYKTADLFCAPSTGDESFGIVLLEAMAAGTPIVASDILGYRTVIRDGVTGLLVPPGREDMLAEVLVGLLRDPGTRLSLREAALREVRKYDWARICAQIESVYLSLSAGYSLQRRPWFGSPTN